MPSIINPLLSIKVVCEDARAVVLLRSAVSCLHYASVIPCSVLPFAFSLPRSHVTVFSFSPSFSTTASLLSGLILEVYLVSRESGRPADHRCLYPVDWSQVFLVYWSAIPAYSVAIEEGCLWVLNTAFSMFQLRVSSSSAAAAVFRCPGSGPSGLGLPESEVLGQGVSFWNQDHSSSPVLVNLYCCDGPIVDLLDHSALITLS